MLLQTKPKRSSPTYDTTPTSPADKTPSDNPSTGIAVALTPDAIPAASAAAVVIFFKKVTIPQSLMRSEFRGALFLYIRTFSNFGSLSNY